MSDKWYEVYFEAYGKKTTKVVYTGSSRNIKDELDHLEKFLNKLPPDRYLIWARNTYIGAFCRDKE